MSGFRLSPKANRDLDDIFDYIARDSFKSAVTMLDAFRAKFRLISQSPLGYPLAEEGEPPLRRAIEGNYKIFYRPEGDHVRIERIVHGARLPPDDL